jgi:hypothetical protein
METALQLINVDSTPPTAIVPTHFPDNILVDDLLRPTYNFRSHFQFQTKGSVAALQQLYKINNDLSLSIMHSHPPKKN